jgi:hypothetical protein
MFNILNVALRLIPAVNFQYREYLGSELSAVGQDVPQYGEWQAVRGHAQPLKKNLYEKIGLQISDNAYNFFIPAHATGVSQKISPDQILFSGKTWDIVKTADWFSYDGWVAVVAIERKNYYAPEN